MTISDTANEANGTVHSYFGSNFIKVFSGSVLNMSVVMCTAVRSQDDSQQQVNTMHYKILRISDSVEQYLCRATPVHVFHHGNLLPIV